MNKTLTGNCKECKKEWTLVVPMEQYDLWKKGLLIQYAFPMLSADERELLITGICGTCFDKLFTEDTL